MATSFIKNVGSYFVTEPACAKVLFGDWQIFDKHCLTQFLSKLAGYAIVTLSVLLKVCPLFSESLPPPIEPTIQKNQHTSRSSRCL